MQTDETLQEAQKELAEELHRTMRYFNELIRRADHAGLDIDLQTLKMYRANRVIPQLDFSARPVTHQPA